MNGWDEFRFAWPWALALVALLGPVAWAGVRGSGQRRIRLSTLALVPERGGRAWMRHAPLALRLAALFALILAAARPQGGARQREVDSDGVDIVLAVDTSGSMQAMDFTLGGERVTRLEVARDVVKKFIEGRVNDRIGLVVFGEEAFVQCPTTTDYSVLLGTLDAVRLGMAGDGTAIGSAVGESTLRLKDLPGRSRVLVLMTDGENTSGLLDPLQAARAAARYGIRIYTVGVGTEGKAPFEVRGPFGTHFVQQEVRLDEASLRAIAQATDGRYWRATSAEKLEEIYAIIDSLERTEVQVREFTDYHELYRAPLLLGLVLLLAELALRGTLLRTLP